MHEGIISRAQIMGMEKRKQILFFNEFNCVLLCGRCNIDNPPSREKIWKQQKQIYGGMIDEWYSECRAIFKSKLRSFE